MALHICNSRAPAVRWELETEDASEAPESAGLVYIVVKPEEPISRKIEGKHGQLRSPLVLRVRAVARADTPIHTHYVGAKSFLNYKFRRYAMSTSGFHMCTQN